MNKYAQFNSDGLVISVVNTEGVIDDPLCILVEGDQDVMGMRWHEGQFVKVEKSQSEIAAEGLREVDRSTGMPRLLRETLIAMAGDKAPAFLVQQDAKAAALRAKLAK